MTSFVRRIALFISFSCIFAGDPEALGTAFMASVQGYDFGGKSVPRWTGGSLIALDRSDTEEVEVRAFDRTGSLVSHFPFRIPAAYRLTPKSGQFARGFDGSFVLAGGAYSDDSRAAPFIAWISSDGSQQRVITISPFVALRVILAADGMIWAAGRELMDGQEGDPNHHIIRRFDPSGRLLNSSIPRPSHKGLHPVTRSHLVASRDRVGWFSELGSQYLEFTLDGTLVSTFPGPVLTARDQITGVALCDDGGFFTSVNLREGATYKGWRILSLDRTSGAWRVVTRTDQPTAWGALLGCDGNSLVTTSGLPNLVWLSRAQANQD